MVPIFGTDYPVIRTHFAKIELGNQDFSQKKQARVLFVDSVYNYMLNKKRPLVHLIEQKTGLSVDELSKAYIQRLQQRTKDYQLSAIEERLLTRFIKLPRRTLTRMTPGRLWWMLKEQSLLSTFQVVSQDPSYKVRPYTPDIENQLFGAYDYIFAHYTVGWGDPKKYGSVAITIKESVVWQRSWATPHSVWRVLKNQDGDFAVAQRAFADRILVPPDYSESLKLRMIDLMKQWPESFKVELLTVPDSEFVVQMQKWALDPIELKYKSYLDMDEIESIVLPPAVTNELRKMVMDSEIMSHSVGF